MAGLAKSLEANFSRYADDLTFSGQAGITNAVLKAVPEIVRDEGFQTHGSKTRVMAKSGRQTVTGIVVNQKINIHRDRYDVLKATLHACAKPADFRLQDPVFRAELQGKIGWVEAINPAKGAKLRSFYYAAICQKTEI